MSDCAFSFKNKKRQGTILDRANNNHEKDAGFTGCGKAQSRARF
jgi:hypothetical protein